MTEEEVLFQEKALLIASYMTPNGSDTKNGDDHDDTLADKLRTRIQAIKKKNAGIISVKELFVHITLFSGQKRDNFFVNCDP